jgi:hypothetical protein
MRTSWNEVSRALPLLVLVAMVGLPNAFADDTSPSGPPEARIKPPSGVVSQARILPPSGITSQARIKPPSGEPTTDSRIRPPGGTPQTDARIGPPSGVTAPEPSWYELLIDWLCAHGRIAPPTS